jgi:pyruvate formate lyase activating enzyme
MAETEGLIFKIKRFTVHDGPGIRTSVFLKGCPLNCVWCHSPEGISSQFSVWYDRSLCIACGQCVKACKRNAVELAADTDPHIVINYKLCNVNGDCIISCPTGALQYTGTVMSVSEIIDEAEKDLLYYQKSGGGVTLTGGEPLYQPEFSLAILKSLKEKNIHTAIETSLFCESEALKTVADYVDLYLIDLKIFDHELHIRYTGKSNEIIKYNFNFLTESGKKIIVRIPMIKGITDTEENKNAIAGYLNDINSQIPVEYIPYNPLAENNYRRLGIPFLLK